MELLKLLGIVIVILGFALKKDPILIIVCAALVTAFVGDLSIIQLLETFGKVFVANRSMTIFITVMLVTGTMERNGLREAASTLIGKVKGATPGSILGTYAVIRGIFGSFNVGIGGVAGFVRPVLMPMTTGSIESKGLTPHEKHVEGIKSMAAAVENIIWFFCQVLFVGGAGALLVQSTLAGLGYKVELIDLAKVEIPVAIFAIIVTVVYFFIRDKALMKKYYNNK